MTLVLSQGLSLMASLSALVAGTALAAERGGPGSYSAFGEFGGLVGAA